jgi:hypothetical protein
MAAYATSGRLMAISSELSGRQLIADDGDKLAGLSEDARISRRRQVAPETQVSRPAGIIEKIPGLAEVDLHPLILLWFGDGRSRPSPKDQVVS